MGAGMVDLHEARCAAAPEERYQGTTSCGGTIMATRVRWLGHACVLVESDGRRVLIDPFLTGNPAAAVQAEEVPADFILVSHGHSDHVGDTIAIAKRTGAMVVANYEISQWL